MVTMAGGFCLPSPGQCLTSRQAEGSTAQVSTRCHLDSAEKGKAKAADGYQDGMYGNFAGRDASRGMAKQSFDLGTRPPSERYRGADSITMAQEC